MKIAFFGVNISQDYKNKFEEILKCFIDAGFELSIYKEFKEYLECQKFNIFDIQDFTDIDEKQTDIIISLGGDGTFLKCAHLCYKKNIPILGINFGKLGFLAQTNPNDITQVIQYIKEKKYSVKKRFLLDFSLKNDKKTTKGIGLNEITLQKSNAVKLIKINVFVGKEFLCSFWADGVVVSTPTGSTGYSLSLGSPILTPDNHSIIITPIAPHTLNIRPIIIPDNEDITLEATGEFTEFLISNDYQSQTIKNTPIIHIKKSRYSISTLEMPNTTFFCTLRDKLNLGMDIRK
ncbi:MAG: NAD(+)/NADH kinase [Bacteroidales bacterium]|nr:NAD(+)/NADH kinase [Bacteroidales bacterium]